MFILLVILLLVLALGGLPTWGYHSYGYVPSRGGKHMVQVFVSHVESPEIASMGGSISEPQLKPTTP